MTSADSTAEAASPRPLPSQAQNRARGGNPIEVMGLESVLRKRPSSRLSRTPQTRWRDWYMYHEKEWAWAIVHDTFDVLTHFAEKLL